MNNKSVILFLKIVLMLTFSLSIVAFAEYSSFRILESKRMNVLKSIKNVDLELNKVKYSSKIITFRDFYPIFQERFRTPCGVNFVKKPIIIFGCSVAYGEYLKNEETFSYMLSKLTKRPVYNFAFSGFGLQHMLFQLQNEKETDKINNPKMVIFLFTEDHIRRINLESFSPLDKELYLKYEKHNNSLVEKKQHSFCLDKLYLTRSLKYYMAIKDYNENMNSKRYEDLILLHILESQKIIAKKYPEAELVILFYEPTTKEKDVTRRIKADLTKYKIKYTTTTELMGKNLSENPEYTFPDSHPKAIVWKILTPEFVKKYNL